ncbi:RnfABCDGE type electron transport complex subunit B [Eubacterium multiforme]|uniref:Ion-translocating oxidoreductase complex subunit B n=1 Tax=Eubacterium multiforme TaxID=83339 RepID=A0ABT9UXE5_9FIRM|nr:Fe-S cluster domain-containing protein [Eubacterium multiforme]MDQ0150987.1 RnfABCDGE-type electron transport complex B subunit [Eubacterium multiforme]
MDFSEILYPVLSLGGLGVLLGLGLGYASKKFKVEVDERIPLIKDCLPGANCGGCGYAGCEALAQAIVDDNAPVNACTVGGEDAANNIAKIMGVTAEKKEPKKAFVKCAGSCDVAKKSANYYGIKGCKEAAIIPGGGNKACSYGCLGFGSCVEACQFDAISVIDGVAVVDPEKCTGCGACVKECPKNIIELKPISEKIRVQCSSKDKLKEVKLVCDTGCIGCGICQRNCPSEAIQLKDNLPVIDKDKCTLCMTCVEKCPVKIIKYFELKEN